MKQIALLLFGLAQTLLALRVLTRMVASRGGATIRLADPGLRADPVEAAAVIVPVLNEAERLAPCLDGLIAHGAEISEIIVVDGGSTDGTRQVVESFAARDSRIRWVDASPVPAGINGKAHNLQRGLETISTPATWVITIDADVRPSPALARSLIAHAEANGVAALSVAARQRLSGRALGLLHPSMLATLVYRFGIPGHATTRIERIQANGQCFLIERSTLDRAHGFRDVQRSICEDVTLARGLAAAGVAVGFYEAGELIDVEMYRDTREAWEGWTRSLPMRDRYSGLAGWIGLLEVTLVQAAPPMIAVAARRRPWLRQLNLALFLIRIGVLVGTRRAYLQPPATYWMSPLCDLPVALRLWLTAVRRHHRWRGRAVVRGDS